MNSEVGHHGLPRRFGTQSGPGVDGVGPLEKAIGKDQPDRLRRAGRNGGAYFACDFHCCGCVQGRHSSLLDPNDIDCIILMKLLGIFLKGWSFKVLKNRIINKFLQK